MLARLGSTCLHAVVEQRCRQISPPVSLPHCACACVPADPAGEYDEMRLKAAALLRAIGECDGGSGPAAVDEA